MVKRCILRSKNDHNDVNENENNEIVDIRQVSDADINNGIQNLIESLASIAPPSPATASSSSISLTSKQKTPENCTL